MTTEAAYFSASFLQFTVEPFPPLLEAHTVLLHLLVDFLPLPLDSAEDNVQIPVSFDDLVVRLLVSRIALDIGIKAGQRVKNGWECAVESCVELVYTDLRILQFNAIP